MREEDEIKKIQEDLDLCENIRIGLLKDGHAIDSPGVKMVEDRQWYLMLQLYILTEKNASRRARTLRDLGINLN